MCTEPVEVHVFGTRRYELHKNQGIPYYPACPPKPGLFRVSKHAVKLFNKKTGRWEWYPCEETLLCCPVCGKPIRCFYIPGTTWVACCSKECSDRLLDKARQLGSLTKAMEYFREKQAG